jgi:hypothetical protein
MNGKLLSRRQMLKQAGCGFGYLALAAQAAAADTAADKLPHVSAKAKRIIFLFMRGGPAHMDTFDYKPALQKADGQDYAVPRLQQLQKRNLLKLMASPFRFQQHGQAGHWISEVFPHLARHADRLCLLKGMHTDGVDHGQATIKLHTGADTLVRPSLGSWLVYGLGSENRNLPGFVSICPLRSEVGSRGYSNAFLPAATQGTAIGFEDIPAAQATIRHLASDQPPVLQRQQLNLLAALNRDHLQRSGGDSRLEGVIQSFELAFRMQADAPKIMDLADETKQTLAMYGIGSPPTDDFGRQCLMARRFAEAGVRCIQLTHTIRKFKSSVADWDQHSNLRADLALNAAAVDQPIAGLLTDLHQRGLLEDTLVWWGGEFGRTPLCEGRGGNANGRDHNPFGFTMWLAGGGVKGGISHGATDDVGYHAVQDKVHMHDLHATILRLLGLAHEKLTYRYSGRDFRLTDVYGRVVHEIIA